MAKIGLFMCDCGGTLSNVIDYNSIISDLEKSGRLKFIIRDSILCKTGIEKMLNQLKKNKVEKVVVAACTPKLYESTWGHLLEKAGMGYYDLVISNIREQCAWVHKNEPKELVTEKAKALILSAINRAENLEEIPLEKIPVTQKVVVIGGGIAGLTAAQELAEMGIDVEVIEREPTVGGLCLKLGTVFPTQDCSLCVRTTGCPGLGDGSPRRCIYRANVEFNPKIKLHTNSEVVNVLGDVGNFKVVIKRRPRYVDEEKCIRCNKCVEVCPVEVPDDFNLKLTTRKAIYMPFVQAIPQVYTIDPNNCKFEQCGKCVKICPTNAINLKEEEETSTIDAGAIIIATGFEEYNPVLVREYNYGRYPDVITQTELARLLDVTGPTGGRPIRLSDKKPVERIVMIQCVGSRDEKHNYYCSNICCMIALKHAIMIKEHFPEIEVIIEYMDIRPVGSRYEEYYRRARELGVVFIRGRPSDVLFDGKRLIVEGENSFTGEFERIETDLVVLSMAMVPSKGTQELARILGVSLGPDRFFSTVDPKVRPSETNVVGVYLAGAAMTPMDIPNAVSYAAGAVMGAVKLMNRKEIEKPLLTSVVNEDICSKCRICEWACPFDAAHVGEKAAQVDQAKCFGCGICAAACPSSCITLRHHTSKQLTAAINGVLENGGAAKKIVAIACLECGYSTIDDAGMLGMQYPVNVSIVAVPCTASIDSQIVLDAFASGADGVLLIGCDRCHYLRGANVANFRISMLKNLISQFGIEPERIQALFGDCHDAGELVEKIKAMVEKIDSLERVRSIVTH
ncbi:MAG: hydrogenase iron-sulfur subunit [Candidatus Jordarchaeaceae archaeon]